MTGDSKEPDIGIRSCTLELAGMDCASCAEHVELALKSVRGVSDVQVDVMGGRVRMGIDDRASAQAIDGALRRAGYPVQKVIDTPDAFVWATPDAPQENLSWWERQGELLLTASAAILCVAALGVQLTTHHIPTVAVLSIAAVVLGGRYVLPQGLRSLRNGSLDISFLMSAAAIGAIVIGEYVEGASVLVLFAISEYMESRSMERARNAVQRLMAITPQEAALIVEGKETRVPVAQLKPGDTVRVRPGDRIPVDGQVVRGASTINQAAITGESMPVSKRVGDEVFAGTINGDGALDILVDKEAEDTTIAKILHAVQEAQASQSSTQRFVDRFAKYYTPLVVLLTILIAIVPPLLLGEDWHKWIYRGLVLLVVSCPCALVIATPVTMVSALGGAAKNGILFKGGRYLETAASLRAIIWDKTGTLTEGAPSVVAAVPFQDVTIDDLLTTAAHGESQSEHPFATAIVSFARERGIVIDDHAVLETRAIVGRGVETQFQNTRVLIGNPQFLREQNAWQDNGERLLVGQDPTATPVFVSRVTDTSSELLGAILLQDAVRADAHQSLSVLRSLGVQKMFMLTGDGERAANAVQQSLMSEQAGLDDIRHTQLPEDKADFIRKLKPQIQGTIAMVGDGINDAPALAYADLGIAMGHVASDIAMETADVVITGRYLDRLPAMMQFALRAKHILFANIAIALGLKFLFIVLSVTGYATLWMAILADTGATVIVVANGLRAMSVPGLSAPRHEHVTTSITHHHDHDHDHDHVHDHGHQHS